jgi:GT2 family glycosyltransferase
MIKASIIMTAYKRDKVIGATLESICKQKYDYEVIVIEDGDDGGKTRKVVEQFPVKYIQRLNRPDVAFSNPCIPNNIGIKAASGKVLIIQNAENKHITPNSIELLTEPILQNPRLCIFGSVMALKQDGSYDMWYCHPKHNKRPLFFCQAVDRETIIRMGGFDEDFIGYGFDDDDFSHRLKLAGIRFKFSDVLLHHQWHESGSSSTAKEMINNRELFALKKRQGSIIRNRNKEWGVNE